MLNGMFRLLPAIILFSGLVMSGCKQNNGELSTDVVGNQNGKPKITFEETKWNFGKVIAGEKVEHVFEFTNTGDGDLLVDGAHASCGCTIPEVSKKPIRPGEKGHITVKFDSTGKNGPEKKSIEVRANTDPSITMLYIEAQVEEYKAK
jgi:hypothetical protein